VVNKSFSFNLALLIALNLLIKPFYLFGIEVGIQNEVGSAEYGLYYAMFNFTFLFNVLLDMGINNFQKVNVAQHGKEGLNDMATIIPLKIWLTGLFIAVTIAAGLIMNFEDRYWFFIGWMLANHVLSAFLLLLRANLGGLHLFVRDSLLSVLDRFILIISVGYLLYFNSSEFRIEWLVQFQALAYLIAIAVAVIMTPAGSRFHKLDFSVIQVKAMLVKTMPYATLILLMTLYNKVDAVMIERLAPEGLVEAGIYAQAYRLLDAGNNFAFLFAGLLLPMFARMWREERFQSLDALVNQSSRLLIIPAFMVFLWCFFYAQPLMEWLYREHSAASAQNLVWLMGSFVFISAGYVFGTLLTAGNQLKWLNITALITLAINVSVNAILIPKLGAEGAAISSFTSLAFMAAAQIWIAHRQITQPTYVWLKKLTIVVAGTIALALMVQRFDLEWKIALPTLIVSSSLLYVFVGLQKSDLKEMWKMRSTEQ